MSKKNKKSAAPTVEAAATSETQSAPTPKVKKPTIAGVMDEVLTIGGTWDEMVKSAIEKSAQLGLSAKFTKGMLNSHLTYRTKVQNKSFAKALIPSEKGINVE